MDVQAFPARDSCLDGGHQYISSSYLLTPKQFSRLNPPEDLTTAFSTALYRKRRAASESESLDV